MKTHHVCDAKSTIVDFLVIDFTGKAHAFTDDELLKAAQSGGIAAAGELLSRHQTFLYKSVLRLATSAEEAEDAVQDALFRAYVNIGRFRGECKFSSWLIAIGINSVRSAKRKTRRATWVYLDDAEEQFPRPQAVARTAMFAQGTVQCGQSRDTAPSAEVPSCSPCAKPR
jgi:RNA polymerase sigma factor (sigma-70 family)